MGKEVTSRGAGGPDFRFLGKYSSRTVSSDADRHFTEELAQDESEQENLTGLISSKILIRNVSISSVQPLRFRLEFYSRDTFTNSDLNEDTFVGAVELNIPEYGELA